MKELTIVLTKQIADDDDLDDIVEYIAKLIPPDAKFTVSAQFTQRLDVQQQTTPS